MTCGLFVVLTVRCDLLTVLSSCIALVGAFRVVARATRGCTLLPRSGRLVFIRRTSILWQKVVRLSRVWLSRLCIVCPCCALRVPPRLPTGPVAR